MVLRSYGKAGYEFFQISLSIEVPSIFVNDAAALWLPATNTVRAPLDLNLMPLGR